MNNDDKAKLTRPRPVRESISEMTEIVLPNDANPLTALLAASKLWWSEGVIASSILWWAGGAAGAPSTRAHDFRELVVSLARYVLRSARLQLPVCKLRTRS